MAVAALFAAGMVGCTETKTVGLVGARDRVLPLTPATRAELEGQGAVCTPNPTGPVLCTWTNGTATCDLSFDQGDALTRLSCSVDGLSVTCTRPSALYVCSWSDDPGCGDVYEADGRFRGYFCGSDLDGLLRPDAGVSDGGQPPEPDAGVPSACGMLSEEACVSGAQPECRPAYCGACQGATMVRRFMGCFGPNDPVPDCPRPVDCGTDCAQLDEVTCNNGSSACHAVYLDAQSCGCSTPGCCAQFDHCAPGPALCDPTSALCDRVPPVCGGSLVPGIAGGCYEGCVREAACLPPNPPPADVVQCDAQPPVFPRFDPSCMVDADCVVGIRQMDCCGTDVATGISPRELPRFEADARVCASQFPQCRCPDRGVLADDGRFTPDPTAVFVRCLAGTCQTAVR